MQKTPLAKLYTDKIAALNDQLCFFLFTREEFNSKLSQLPLNAQHQYSSQIFVHNKYSQKIYVQINKLAKFQRDNETLTYGSYFSTAYEVVTGYIDSILELISKTNGAAFQLKIKKTPEDTLFASLLASNCALPPNELKHTLSYCRLRRNHFTHLAESLKPQFQNLISNEGGNLNSYWSTTVTALDFADTSVDIFEEVETIDLIKLLRICVIELDQIIASSLNVHGIVRLATEELYAAHKVRLNRLIQEERNRKVRSFVKRKYGISIAESQAGPYTSTIGVR